MPPGAGDAVPPLAHGMNRVSDCLQHDGYLHDGIESQISAMAPVSPPRDHGEGLQDGGEELADGGELQGDGERRGTTKKKNKPGQKRRKYLAMLYAELRGWTQLLLEAYNTNDHKIIVEALQQSQDGCYSRLTKSGDFRGIMTKEGYHVQRYLRMVALAGEVRASQADEDADYELLLSRDLAPAARTDADDDDDAGDDRKPLIVLGMMKTGTNTIVEALMLNQFEVLQNEWPEKEKKKKKKKKKNLSGLVRLGGHDVWKHQPGIVTIKSAVVPIVAIREPLSWLASIRRTRGEYKEYQWGPEQSHATLHPTHYWILSPMKVVDDISSATVEYANIMQFLKNELELVRNKKKLTCPFFVIDLQRFVTNQEQELRDLFRAARMRCPRNVVTTSRHAKTKELIEPEKYMASELQQLDLKESEIECIFKDDIHEWQNLYETFGWTWPLSAAQVL